MTDPRALARASRDRGDWLRLRSFVVLRWIAIVGQIVAITIAVRGFGMQIDLGLCYHAVGAAIAANLVAMFAYPESKRLTESEAMLSQLFDVAQIALLLYLTGGLDNPFALLIIVPVTISAAALDLRSTILLGGVAAALLTLLAFSHVPLVLANGVEMRLPGLYQFGFWLAILITMAFLAAYVHRITEDMHSMADALAATQMALAREQKLTDLGGVVAAAAHELGTPLATIKLVSSELLEDGALDAEQRSDALLIRQQAERCRDILLSMGRAGKHDPMMRAAPLAAVLREVAEPHAGRGRVLHFEIGPSAGAEPRQPAIRRLPEVIHGLRNLVQNAVDFAEANVWIGAEWSEASVTIRIVDDGPGFPPDLLGRIGDPYMRRRPSWRGASRRPEYEGMGLGLFIAKTLLERSGARLTFANASDPFLNGAERPERCGAVVEVVWPRDALDAPDAAMQGGLGENRPILA